MAEVITMPRLSDTMTEGKVAKWHKKVGDTVKEGDILAEIETDKAVQDFESEINGTLLYIGTEEGGSSPVDTVLAIIGKEGEDISALKGGNSADPKTENTIPEEHKTEGKVTDIETNKAGEKESTENAEIPAGVEVISMPRLSDTMTEGKVAKWHFKVGDQIKEGDILAEIETDKAIQDFESEVNGTLLYTSVSEEEASPVDTVLAIIGPAGTDVSGLTSGGTKKAAAKPTAEQSSENVSAAENKEQQPVANSSTERLAISPLAKKMAEDKGIDIHSLQGSGENGRIVKKDIENYQPTTAAPALQKIASSPAVAAPATMAMNFVQGEDSETPNSQVRNIIAKRLSESKFTAPHYYLIVEINMDKAIQARKEINALPDTKISFNDMIIKATAMALRKHPQVNSSWKADKIIHHGNINIGVAVAIPDGLVVPVLKNADQMNYNQISASVKDMAGRAKSKGLKANEMEGSTFSISNLGMFGIETFTSIINQPNSAILSVGAIVEKPVVKDAQIVVGNVMKLSMACDHRVVDGATGAQFLQTLRTYLEQPLTLLL